MISVGVVAGGGIGYYLSTVGSGVDDYYLRAGPGTWYGTGAMVAGVDGEVVEADLHRVLPGLDEPTPAGRRRVAAYDLTFSAPKSVSVLACLADPAPAVAVADAHHRAVAATVALLEAEAARGRRGHAGAETVTVAGVAAAGFDHHASRAGDPQLHTHLLVANRALGADGRWGALDGRRIFAWARTAGFAYQAALRAELTEALGVTWTPVVNGCAEIAGVPAAVLERFSTRRREITAALDAAGAAGPAAAQIATLATRPAKPEPVPAPVQRARWWDQAAAVGLDPDGLTGVYLTARRPAGVDLDTLDALAARLASPAGLTARRSTFDRRDVLRAVAGEARAGIAVAALVSAADAILTLRAFTPAPAGGEGLAGPTWTTVELAAVEAGLLDGVARRRHDTTAAVCPSDAVDAAIAARPALAGEQQALVAAVCRSGRGVEVVVGPAGTGKTWALDAARAAFETAGIPVAGAALAARTALGLQAATAIPSATIDQLLADADRPGPAGQVLPAGGVLVVDEAGMVGTRTLARLLALAERDRVKVVLVGDPRQLPEIDAGGAFARLATAPDTVHLTVNRRQAHAWERDVLARLRDGDTPAAVAALAGHGRLTLTDTAPDAAARLVADWAAARNPARPADTIMVALTRGEVDALNATAAARLQADGHLDPARPTLTVDTPAGPRSFGVGERVVTVRNDRRLGVVNGTAGTLTAVDTAAGTLTVTPDTGHPVALPAAYVAAGHLDHGWATTAHKAQGVTVTRAFLLGSDRLYREAGYVALSRATQRTDWYQPAPTPPAWQPDRPALDDLARIAARSRAQHLATPEPPQPGPGRDHDPGRGYDRDVRVLLADPPAWALTALGPPPAAGPGRHRWADTAGAIGTWRAEQHLAGPDPLGPPPPDPADGPRWAALHAALAESRLHLGVHQPDLGLGLGR